MAHRDKSQGFGFVYADIKTLLAQRDELKKLDNWEPIEVSQEAEVVNLNKDQSSDSAVPAITPIADTTSVDQIKENLDRLAKLHQKLHVMLDEINRMSTKKSSDN
jgi:hypothetical protein